MTDFAAAREKAFHWLIAKRGREANWFWRWKFKTADRTVSFDPDKYGWPWISGSVSWVIPTAFSIIAIKQFTVCNRSEASEKRIHLGVDIYVQSLRRDSCVIGRGVSGVHINHRSIEGKTRSEPGAASIAFPELRSVRHHFFC